MFYKYLISILFLFFKTRKITIRFVFSHYFHRRSWHGPPPCSLRVHLLHLISIMSFKLGHVSIPKRCIFLSLFLFSAYDSSVLQNFNIFTHLLPHFSYKDPRLTEVTYHCINFNDMVRKVPYLNFWNFWNFSDPILEVNAVVRHFRQPWVLIRKIWQ